MKIKLLKLITILSLTFLTIKADKITVHNKTKTPIFAAIYYEKNNKGRISGSIKEIAANSKIKITRPKQLLFNDRELVFTTDKSNLTNKLDKQSHRSLKKENVGYLKGNIFYIYSKNNMLKACNTLEWQLVKPIIEPFETLVEQTRSIYLRHEYSNKKASVRRGNELATGEKNYLIQRKTKTKKAIENMLGIKLGNDENVTISFCCSGGGFRAMTSTLGFLMGAEEIGLINSATYITGLSGSTWMMAPWTAQGNNLKTFKENLIPKTQTNLVDLKNDPWPLDNLSKVVSQVFLPKYIFKQPLRLVDTYGVFLASKLFSDFGNKRERIRLSHSQKRINNGNWIFPIYTAVEVGPPYIWFEFTPYEIGSSQLNSYVPSWSFGRKFNNGQSIDKAPEQSLGYFLAIFGSAFAFSFKEGLNEFTKKIKYPLLRAAIKTSFRHAGQEEQRMSPASIHNFLRGIQGPPKYGNIDFSNITDFTLVDAGIAFNLPFPPLLRAERKTDIIIALDASSTIKNAPALKGAEKFAKNNGLKFPKIDYTNLEKKTISVFKDENDPETPVIIYLPLLKNVNYSTNFNPQKAKFCGTFNFLYTPSQLNKLSGLTKFNILEAKDTIKTAILDTIKRKRKWAKQKEFSMEKSDEVQEEMQEIMN